MDIFVGDYSVYNSGVIILSSDKSITMKIEDTNFVFDFKDEDGEAPDIKLVESNEKSCHLTFLNFNNPLGVSIKEPVLIASMDTGDNLYLQYAISTVNKVVKVFQYTLYTVAITQLVNDYNAKVRAIEKLQESEKQLSSELQYQNANPFFSIIAAIINVVGSVISCCGVNFLTGEKKMFIGYLLILAGSVLLLSGSLLTICYRYVYGWMNKKHNH